MRKIVVLDGYTENPGDLSWDVLKAYGELAIYDRTPEHLTAERMKNAEIVLTNKTVISGKDMEENPALKFISVLATGYNVVDLAAARELELRFPMCRLTEQNPWRSLLWRCSWNSVIMWEHIRIPYIRDGGLPVRIFAIGSILWWNWRERRWESLALEESAGAWRGWPALSG